MPASLPKSPNGALALLLAGGIVWLLSRRAIAGAAKPGSSQARPINTGVAQATTAEPQGVAARFAGAVINGLYGTPARPTPTASAATADAQAAIASAGSFQVPWADNVWRTSQAMPAASAMPDGGGYSDGWTRPSITLVNPFTTGIWQAVNVPITTLSDSVPAAPMFDPATDTAYWTNALP